MLVLCRCRCDAAVVRCSRCSLITASLSAAVPASLLCSDQPRATVPWPHPCRLASVIGAGDRSRNRGKQEHQDTATAHRSRGDSARPAVPRCIAPTAPAHTCDPRTCDDELAHCDSAACPPSAAQRPVLSARAYDPRCRPAIASAQPSRVPRSFRSSLLHACVVEQSVCHCSLCCPSGASLGCVPVASRPSL